MPIYKFRCEDCNHKFEKFVFSVFEPVECPKCNSRNCKKEITTFSSGSCGFRFR